MRRAALFAVALAVAALLPGNAATQPAQQAPQIERVPEGILEVLRDYGRAFETKDRVLLEGVAIPPLVESEVRALDNAADVPFRAFRVRASTQYSGNLVAPRIRARYPGKEVAVYHVIEETALDVESTPYRDDGAFTFTRERPAPADRYDGWRLTAKDDLDVLGFFSPYHLWDAGPVSVLRSEHFVLLTHPEVADEMRSVLGVAERAYAKAVDFWPREVDERYVIIVPSTTEELGELIHATLDLSKFVAFVAGGANREGGWEPTGPRLYIHLSHLRNYGEDGQVEILAHELIHAITRPVSGPRIPVWVEEGLANVGGGTGGRASLARQGPLPDVFPSDERFIVGPVNEIARLYDQAQVAIEALIEEFGHEGLARFYETLGSARVVAGTDTYHVRRASEEALGWTTEEWLAAWRKRLG